MKSQAYPADAHSDTLSGSCPPGPPHTITHVPYTFAGTLDVQHVRSPRHPIPESASHAPPNAPGDGPASAASTSADASPASVGGCGGGGGAGEIGGAMAVAIPCGSGSLASGPAS